MLLQIDMKISAALLNVFDEVSEILICEKIIKTTLGASWCFFIPFS